MLPSDHNRGKQSRGEFRHAVPRFAECGTVNAHIGPRLHP
jgi:hypothetical protein